MVQVIYPETDYSDDDGGYRSSDIPDVPADIASATTESQDLDPSSLRLRAAGLLEGGARSLLQKVPSVAFTSVGTNASSSAVDSDWRVRLSLSDANRSLYNSAGNTLLSPLKRTRGVIWPYVPSITLSHTANYTSAGLTHSNYAQYFYDRSEVGQITISGDFTVQNVREGQYVLAVVMFLRAATKMLYGSEPNAGTPPVILFLDGFGQHYFPHVPVVVQSFQHTITDDVDFLEVPIYPGNNSTIPSLSPKLPGQDLVGTNRVPVRSTVVVTLVPVYSRSRIHREFTVEKFAKGDFIARDNGGFL